MIKPLNPPQLSASKPRTGLQSIGELIPRLIRQYELQAEILKRRSEPTHLPTVRLDSNTPQQQATFAWFE